MNLFRDSTARLLYTLLFTKSALLQHSQATIRVRVLAPVTQLSRKESSFVTKRDQLRGITVIFEFLQVSAVSQKTNTTQQETLGVVTEGDVQVLVFDTPGVVDARYMRVPISPAILLIQTDRCNHNHQITGMHERVPFQALTDAHPYVIIDMFRRI